MTETHNHTADAEVGAAVLAAANASPIGTALVKRDGVLQEILIKPDYDLPQAEDPDADKKRKAGLMEKDGKPISVEYARAHVAKCRKQVESWRESERASRAQERAAQSSLEYAEKLVAAAHEGKAFFKVDNAESVYPSLHLEIRE